ncbi:CvpA family protein [Tundrisphaera lichenicola]|uniref:CvpA family protein n=1 Tax=Tundrisphaera lichenicola TaxID=2029860 RepID=UPI003EBDC932
MGLDIALGVMILFGAIRGWFRGFVLQSIQLAGLVGSVYAAGPIRDQVGPHVAPYLKTIDPSLLGRMLWWSSAVVAYIAIVGLSSIAVKLYRKRPYGEPEPNYTDQFAGFLLAAGKGAVMVAFLIGAFDRYVLTHARQLPWAAEQIQTSKALVWNQAYKPAERIWSAMPVQRFVAHVRQMGVDAPDKYSMPESSEVKSPTVQTAAARPPRLDLPAVPRLDPESPDFVEKFDQALRQVDRP